MSEKWEVRGEGYSATVFQKDGGLVAQVTGDAVIRPKRCRLISAAPELYEALKLAKQNIQFLPEEGVEEKIAAALAKADGSQ